MSAEEGQKQRPKNFVPVPENAKIAKARHERIDVYENIGKLQLVPGGVSSNYKKGKSAGFYCNVCDLTFKDSLSYTTHLNSKQHLHASGLKVGVTKITVEQVRERLAMLRNKRLRESKKEEYDIKKRIAARKELEEKLKLQKKRRREKQLSKKMAANSGCDALPTSDMMAVMGLSGFGSTKR